MLQRLPPILHKPVQQPISNCSKAPRGLFVLLRVGRIYTANSISPSLSPRQRSSRYTIRAGQNLPDKEFRYLRTVIVTAAVHRGFSSQLAPLPLTFRHRAGVTPYTSPCGFAESCDCGKQSLEPIYCARLGLLTLPRDPFSRSYGAILQSSLERVLSRALVLLHSPTCVGFGTGTRASSFRGFSWHLGFNQLSPPKGLPELRHYNVGRIFLSQLASQPAGHSHSSGWPILMQTPSLHTSGVGILTHCPSTTPFGLALGPA
jgi:hypothetical protein